MTSIPGVELVYFSPLTLEWTSPFSRVNNFDPKVDEGKGYGRGTAVIIIWASALGGGEKTELQCVDLPPHVTLGDAPARTERYRLAFRIDGMGMTKAQLHFKTI